jgi:hypothetical protein
MSVDDEPADPTFMAAQRQAMEAKRGIWSHGIPAYVMTSLHSTTEGGGSEDGTQYNRMVSTFDGHSNSMRHKDAYDECQWVCSKERSVTDASVTEAVEALKTRGDLDAILGDLTDAQVAQIVRDYAHVGWFSRFRKDKEKMLELELALAKLTQDGLLPGSVMGEGSCVIYVEFKRRYGKSRPGCLR